MQFCLHGAFQVYIKTSSLQFANTQMTEKVLILQHFLKDDLHVAQINSKYSPWFLKCKVTKFQYSTLLQQKYTCQGKITLPMP